MFYADIYINLLKLSYKWSQPYLHSHLIIFRVKMGRKLQNDLWWQPYLHSLLVILGVKKGKNYKITSQKYHIMTFWREIF